MPRWLPAGRRHTALLAGNVFRKQGRWSDAINCYLKAEAIDPASPAAEARAMLDDIFAFYNKDMYNQ